MSTVQEIKQAIESLSPNERVQLERLLVESDSPATRSAALPDQAARRHAILGHKVLPNLVLEARDAAHA